VRKLVITLCLIVIVILGGLLWWNIPTSITNISPSEVSKIEICDGSTGKITRITDELAIEHIIENLNATSIKKEDFSLLGWMGYSFSTTIYKIDDSVYKKFIINSGNTIRKGQFLYRTSSGKVDYEYIKNLIRSKTK